VRGFYSPREADMARRLYTVGVLYPLPGQQVFVLGGAAPERPVVSRDARALFRQYRQFFHVYRLSADCSRLRLAIASEWLEEETGEALDEVRLDGLQQARLARSALRALVRHGGR
jgi:hypothetical protein